MQCIAFGDFVVCIVLIGGIEANVDHCCCFSEVMSYKLNDTEHISMVPVQG